MSKEGQELLKEQAELLKEQAREQASGATVAMAATAQTKVPKPPSYIMGEFVESYPGTSDWHIIAGGKPKPDWSGRDATDPNRTFVPTQLRGYKNKYQAIEYEKRTEPMKTKFKEGMSLKALQKTVTKHGQAHGLDTWHYLSDPFDHDKMLDVVTDYPKFLASVEDTSNRALELSQNKFDKFDKENSKAGATYLFNSLSPELQDVIELAMKEGEQEVFICVWIRVLQQVTTVSSRFYDDIKDKIKSCCPNQFAQESIEKWNAAIQPHIDILQSGGFYDHSLTEVILQNLSDGCSVRGYFGYEASARLSKVKVAVRESTFMEREAADTHMKDKKLDVKTILREMLQIYNDLHRENKWTPSKMPKDRNALRGAHAVGEIPSGLDLDELSKAIIANLQFNQSSNSSRRQNSGARGGRDKSNDICNNCGKKGHWASECRSKKSSDGGNQGASQSSRGRNQRAPSLSGTGQAKEANWRRVPPAPGGSETMRKNGNPFYWCAKCRHWNKTHVTSAHVRRPVAGDRESAINLALDPSAWVVTTTTPLSGNPTISFDDELPIAIDRRDGICFRCGVPCRLCQPEIEVQHPELGSCPTCGAIGHFGFRCHRDGSRFEGPINRDDVWDVPADGSVVVLDNSTASSPLSDNEIELYCPKCDQFAHFLPSGIMCGCANNEEAILLDSIKRSINAASTSSQKDGSSQQLAARPDNYLCPAGAKHPSLPPLSPRPDNYLCPASVKQPPAGEDTAENEERAPSTYPTEDDPDLFPPSPAASVDPKLEVSTDDGSVASSMSDRKLAATIDLPKSVGTVVANSTVGFQEPSPTTSTWWSQLWPFLYLPVLWFGLPKLGLHRTAYIAGLVHSVEPVLSVCFSAFSSMTSDVLASGLSFASFSSVQIASVSTCFWTHLPVVRASLAALPWSAYAGPALWLGLLFAATYPPSFGQSSKSSGSRSARASRRAVLQHDKRFRRRAARWSQTYRAPRLRGKRYHRPHQKPRNLAPTIRERSVLRSQSAGLSHAQSLLQHSPRYHRGYARRLGKVRGDLRRQFKNVAHTNYSVRSPATSHNPWSQNLTKGQANVLKSLTVEGWFAQRQSELETAAYERMHNAWKEYKAALVHTSKVHPKAVSKLEAFLHAREQFSCDSNGHYKLDSWPTLSKEFERDLASLQRGYFTPAIDSKSAKARKKAKVALIAYLHLKSMMPSEPTTEQLFYLQESFRRFCNLRLAFWKKNGKQGPSPWKPNYPRHIYKAQKADGSFVFINTVIRKGEAKDKEDARLAKVTSQGGCKSCKDPCHTRRSCQANCAVRESIPKVDLRNTAGFPIIWDSGASVCITPAKTDFISFDQDSNLASLQGFSSEAGQKVEGSGTVRWYVEDDSGKPRCLEVKAYYVPTSRVRLLSTTILLKTYKGEHVYIEEGQLTLSGIEGDSSRGRITAPTNKTSDLPVSIGRSVPKYNSVINAYSVVANENFNLTAAEKELLRWHQRLGHIAFRKVQHLMRSGVLAHSESTKRLHRIACRSSPVKCAACQYAKQRARPAPGVTSKIIKDRQGVLSKNQLLPGQEVCVDHFVCSSKGRLFTSRGASRDSDMYKGGAIFVDQATGYIHVEHQTTLTTHATLRAKESYEAMCRDYGVIPQKYLSDNGTAFTSAGYRNHLVDFAQVQRFAGAGAHHHNSRAERAIQTIMSISRAMLMHSFIHWPDMEDTALWPMAVNHAVYLWNHVPDPATGLCSADLFTKTRFEQSKLLDVHVFGCPVYVLDKTIADGKKIPKWKPRSRRCMYVGRSPSHASTVPLVLNPDTGTITPQFHVVFDDWFATVEGTAADLPDFNSPAWQQLFGDSTYQYVLDDDDLEALDQLTTDLENSIDSDDAEFARNRVLEAAEQLRPSQPLPPPSYSHTPALSLPHASRREKSHAEPQARRATANDDVRAPSPTPSVEPTLPLPAPPVQGSPETAKGSGDTAEGSTNGSPNDVTGRTTEEEFDDTSDLSQPAPLPGLSSPIDDFAHPVPMLFPSKLGSTTKSRASPGRPVRQRYNRKILDPSNPSTFVTAPALPPQVHFAEIFSAFQCPLSLNAASKNKNNPDILTFDQAMASPDRDKWIKSAQLEIKELEDHGCWKEVPLSEAEGHKIVPSQWVFRLKRRPDGSVSKYKGRIVLRGDLMEDIYDVTSPVVAFSTVRLFLIMALHLGWYTCSVDFSNAFIQAKRPDKVFMHMPRGFKGKDGHILQLIRNVYGACDGPKLWAELLFKSLRKLGFTQSKIDPCLWYKPTCFIICFVDDCGIAVKKEEDADILIKQLEELGFSLTKESSFEEFLGIQYAKLANGDVELTQVGLIKKILTATGLLTCNPNRVPAQVQLGKDEDGADMTDDWSYPSIIGMLLYLSTNTRPDITFAVSQAARFTHSPKQSHAQAVKTIVRYLAKTIDKGTIVKKPNSAIKLDCYVDADFAGLYKIEDDKSVNSAKSRSGYIIKLGGCPLIWKSQLIPTICLSTAESEYYSLSQSMRALLPIQSLVSEFMERVDVPVDLRGVEKVVHATAHEDNTSALSLATEQRLTSRTRHYHCRWHFFWQAVQTGQVEVIYCETQEQDADYMTKPLVFVTFIANRRRVQGW